MQVDHEHLGFVPDADPAPAADDAHASDIRTVPLTQTGLDNLTQWIFTDPDIPAQLEETVIAASAAATSTLNLILLKGISATGIAQDGQITSDDVLVLNEWVLEHYPQHWADLHGQLAAFYAACATDTAPGRTAVDLVAEGVFALGFPLRDGYFAISADVAPTRAEDVAYWLNALLARDMVTFSTVQADTLLDQLPDPDDMIALLLSEDSIDRASLADAIVLINQEPTSVDGVVGYAQVDHKADFALPNFSVVVKFALANAGVMTKAGVMNAACLFSKCSSAKEDGAMALTIQNGLPSLEMTDSSGTTTLAPSGVERIVDTASHTVCITCDDSGTAVSLDGKIVAEGRALNNGWAKNDAPLLLGGNGSWRSTEFADFVHDILNGEITDFAVFDRTLTQSEQKELAAIDAPLVDAFLAPAVHAQPEFNELPDLFAFSGVQWALDSLPPPVPLGQPKQASAPDSFDFNAFEPVDDKSERQEFVSGLDKVNLKGFATVTPDNVLNGGFLTQTDDGVLFSAEGANLVLPGMKIGDITVEDFIFG